MSSRELEKKRQHTEFAAKIARQMGGIRERTDLSLLGEKKEHIQPKRSRQLNLAAQACLHMPRHAPACFSRRQNY